MEKFFNDIVTFIAEMDMYLKCSIIALLTIMDILLLRVFFKNLANKDNKPKIRIANVLLLLIISGIIVLLCLYGFNL